MTEQQINQLLSAEMQAWARKSIDQVITELSESQGYERGIDDLWHQFEVGLLENTPDYIHVGISVDDGSAEYARSPISSSFIMHRDGRVEL